MKQQALGSFPLSCLENAKDKLEALISENNKGIDELIHLGKYTYANFVKPFMDFSDRITDFFTPISHLQQVKNSEESKIAFSSCLTPLTIYSTELAHDKRIYNAFKKIKDNEYNELDSACRKVLDDSIKGFELSGVGLDDKSKAELKEINIRLSELSDKFSQNLMDATNAYKLKVENESDLGDMPESDKLTAKTEDGWEFSLQMPSYIAFMTYSTNRSLRQEMYKAYSTRAPENSPLIAEIMALREKKSKILGFDNYAQMKIESMSAPSVPAVISFLERLANSGRPFAEKELIELKKFALDKDNLKDLMPYDVAFYSEKLKKETFHYDEEELRPYFEKNTVVNGMFRVLNTLYGLDFKKQTKELWDSKAVFYEVYRDGSLIGGLYLDLESRSDKRGGAWMNDWHTHYLDSKGNRHLPEVFIVANFPVSSENTPSLLRHNDVTTLFHEMGHALHHLLSLVDEAFLSGVNGIDWDTVEFPSQFFENYAFTEEVLDICGKHYKTGKPIGKDLKEKVLKSKNFQAGLALMRQIEFGLFDMLIHNTKVDKNPVDQVQSILNDVRKKVAVIIPPAYNRFQNSFSHIFSGGYAAGYYSYKWAEMLSSDAFYIFVKNGIFNQEYAQKYRDTVLKYGASKDMGDIYREFAGRDPDPDSILKLAGLA